jgi:hypothetical protein
LPRGEPALGQCRKKLRGLDAASLPPLSGGCGGRLANKYV